MNIKKEFGMRLKELRCKKGITQYQLAEAAGIDPKHMSHIETGRSFPKADLIEKFAGALGVNYTELFCVKHLADREILMDKINNSLKNLPDKEFQRLYRIITAYID